MASSIPTLIADPWDIIQQLKAQLARPVGASLPPGATNAEAIAHGLIETAQQGSDVARIRACTEILNRLHGLPKQQIEQTDSQGRPITVDPAVYHALYLIAKEKGGPLPPRPAGLLDA
jgi:hypothetical protein